MKILLVHKFWRKVGGAEVYFQDVARILRKEGHEVKIFSTDYEAEGSQDVFHRDENVIFGAAADYLQGSLLSKIRNVPEVIYSTKNKEHFRSVLKSFQPDIVHVFAIYITITPSILDACREENVPVVMSCNDYKHICPNYRLFHHGRICNDCKGGKFYNALLNNCCKHSLAVSLISTVEAYVHDFKDIWKKNVHTFLFESRFMMDKTVEFWGEGAASLSFLGKPFNATLHQPRYSDQNYLLYIGRLSDEKGVDILVTAMKQVPEAKLLIAGDGNYRSEIEKIIENEQINNVELLGSKWGADLEELLLNCRFVVVPSLWYENFPYVMMEAYSRGKAVIGSDMGGIPEYIEEGKTGHVFPSRDPGKLALHISDLWNNPEKARQMGKNAKEFADREFNDESFYLRLSAIYQKATGKSI